MSDAPLMMYLWDLAREQETKMVSRYRLTDESTAVPHPEGEVVLTADHEREVARLRALMNKVSEDARAWKAYAARVRAAIGDDT